MRKPHGGRQQESAGGLAKKKMSPPQDEGSFPVVGIGSSAGGLEALGQFLSHVPAKSGIAFVIVQHLDPTHKGIMPELLQRETGVTVLQATDLIKVEPDHAYVIPPGKDMSILHGALHLFEPAAPRGLRLPIDFFFRSLADDRKDRSIGVILSGMGSDGTEGLRAIKAMAGLALVQEPSSAKFDGMPRSAIDAGLVDIVAPVEELPRKITDYLAHAVIPEHEISMKPHTQGALEKIAILLRDYSGQDFSLYKKNMIYRRIQRRMNIHQIDNIASYVRFLQENQQEKSILFKELLIGVTGFFRDHNEWTLLKKALGSVLSDRKGVNPLKAWVVGCSTGEEAYSLSIVLKEALEDAGLAGKVPVQIFATDLDRDAIEKARQGVFPDGVAADISPERLKRFFYKEERGYRVRKEIRETIVFAEQNVLQNAPFTKLDVLTCRNLLIYLSPEAQNKLVPLFHYSLNPGGILFLGNAETIGTFTDLFSVLDSKSKLYRRLTLEGQSVEFPTSFLKTTETTMHGPLEPKPVVNLQALADQLLLQNYSPAAVLTNSKGDILYITGKTGKYLEPAAGKANWNIFAMAREGLHYELLDACRKALSKKKAVVLRGLSVRTNGSMQTVNLTVQAIQEPAGLAGMVMFIFSDVDSPPADPKVSSIKGAGATYNKRVAAMEEELRKSREDLQAYREEMQTSQEEAKSANEELQSTNEELQSTNEELTTSKEELQSLNEELQTVNAELQARVDNLSRAESDWENLLNSTDIATLFLDDELRIRRFTPKTTKIFKLLPGDTNRPITDLVSDLDYPEMAEDTKKVLKSLILMEKEVSTRDGRWFSVRIMPYRTIEKKIDGVVITFTEITVAKTLEAKLRTALQDEKSGKLP